MTEYRVILVPQAYEDLDSIVDYVEKDSPQDAAAIIDRIWKAAQSLSQLPHRYKAYKSARKPDRVIHAMPVPPFIVYYRVIEHPPTVRIVSIRRGTRRPPTRFD